MTIPTNADEFSLRFFEHLMRFEFPDAFEKLAEAGITAIVELPQLALNSALINDISVYLVNEEEALQGSDYTEESLETWLQIAMFIYGFVARSLLQEGEG